jgi:hypothetical protein
MSALRARARLHAKRFGEDSPNLGPESATERRRVENRRLVLDEPTTLREGTIVDLVVDDEDDDLTDDEHRAPKDALSASCKSTEAGRVRPATVLLDELRQRR